MHSTRRLFPGSVGPACTPRVPAVSPAGFRALLGSDEWIVLWLPPGAKVTQVPALGRFLLECDRVECDRVLQHTPMCTAGGQVVRPIAGDIAAALPTNFCWSCTVVLPCLCHRRAASDGATGEGFDLCGRAHVVPTASCKRRSCASLLATPPVSPRLTRHSHVPACGG